MKCSKPPIFVPLRNLQTAIPEKLNVAIQAFQCDRDNELAEFLKDRAALFEQKGKSRTYLLLDYEMLRRGNANIIAFFSVAPQVMFVPSSLSVRQIRRLDGFSGKMRGKKIEALPVYLLGQLAKNDDCADRMTGHELLLYAWKIIKQAQSLVGGRIVMADVKTSAEGLIRFYKRENFQLVSQSEETGLSQLIYMLDD